MANKILASNTSSRILAQTSLAGAPVRISVAVWTASFLLAHHLAVFVHEYAHSFMAFALGYKSNPFWIHFGSYSFLNLLLLGEINENVDCSAMFTHGAGVTAALVAFAGPGLGNGLTYLGSMALLKRCKNEKSSGTFLFAYALNLMSVGNFFSYVPIRTFASHGDIGHIEQGLGVSPWLPLVLLSLPTLAATWWFFSRTLPMAVICVDPSSLLRRKLLVTLSTAIFFGFFGGAGWSGYGPISHSLSFVSLLWVPVMMAICWPRAFGVR